MPRRAYESIIRHGVVACVIQVMRPFINLFWPGLDHLFPAMVFLDIGHAFRAQHSHYLIHGHVAKVFGDNEVNEIISVWKPVAT